MGFSESGHGCKIHPHHHPNQGVCPSCLRERLSSLSWITSYQHTSFSFSPRYYSVSSSISTSPSPSQRHHDSHKQNGFGESMGIVGLPPSSSFTVKFDANGVKKSRSIAFVPRNFDDDDEEKEVKDGKKKEKGFWSKLLRFKGKNKDVLRHSKSMRLIERVNMVS
ncbi:hypothetical protein V6N13_064721 [Hibiscus sabdariffa]|uniref:Uncharacterized protein n=2 Tax=Hibiscus sabdariffa TaxID=183260 RepID=A0ABR2EBD8_9ROSI